MNSPKITLVTESQFENKDTVSPSQFGCKAHVNIEKVRDDGEVLLTSFCGMVVMSISPP